MNDNPIFNARLNEHYETEAIEKLRDLVMVMIAHLPINEVYANLRSLGFDPNEPLPDRLACLTAPRNEITQDIKIAANEPTSKQGRLYPSSEVQSELHNEVMKRARIILADAHTLMLDA